MRREAALAPVPHVKAGPDDMRIRTYDFDGDGKPDYRETLDASGQVRYQAFDPAGDGTFSDVLDRATLDLNSTKHVFLLLDGVPYSLMDEMWRQGHFRLFSRPGQMISTFPSLTDPAYYRIFHCGRPYGYEAEFYDRTTGRQTSGTSFYLSGKNEAWVHGTDHRISLIEDAVMYLWPAGVFHRELAACRKVYERKKNDNRLVLYLLSTDGICHMFPREQAKAQLALLDRWIEQIAYEARGRIEFTMLADHGNNFAGCRYINIRHALKHDGLHVGKTLRKKGDVVAPWFGLINFGSVCCYGPAERDRAVAAIRALDGVEAVAWRARDGQAGVTNRKGTAVIQRKIVGDEPFYSYKTKKGDPLGLADTLAGLRAKGLVRSDGFVSDDAWFDATKASDLPYAVPRLYESLYGDVRNPADIVISLADGYFYGDPSLTKWVTLIGTHGGLSRESSVSFLMSSAFVAPRYIRTGRILPVINEYVTWTPHIPWTQYAWLDKYRALQNAPFAQKDGRPVWPDAVRTVVHAPTSQSPASQPADGVRSVRTRPSAESAGQVAAERRVGQNALKAR